MLHASITTEPSFWSFICCGDSKITSVSAAIAAKLFEPTPLVKGEEYEGLISKITDYGFFVRIGHEQHMGLVHIRIAIQERWSLLR